MDVKTAVEIIASSVDAREAIEKLGLLPCRLHALLNSRAFIQAMDNYRLVTKSIVTIRAGQYGGWMMGNLANLTNGNNEDSARKACMAGLSQALDGHIRPGPGRRAAGTSPARPAGTSPAQPCQTSAETSQAFTSRERKRPEPTSPPKPPLDDMRKEILDFIQDAPSALKDPQPAPSSIDIDQQTATEIHDHDFDNSMHSKELHLETHPTK